MASIVRRRFAAGSGEFDNWMREMRGNFWFVVGCWLLVVSCARCEVRGAKYEVRGTTLQTKLRNCLGTLKLSLPLRTSHFAHRTSHLAPRTSHIAHRTTNKPCSFPYLSCESHISIWKSATINRGNRSFTRIYSPLGVIFRVSKQPIMEYPDHDDP